MGNSFSDLEDLLIPFLDRETNAGRFPDNFRIAD
jgi:hypothetical protein